MCCFKSSVKSYQTCVCINNYWFCEVSENFFLQCATLTLLWSVQRWRLSLQNMWCMLVLQDVPRTLTRDLNLFPICKQNSYILCVSINTSRCQLSTEMAKRFLSIYPLFKETFKQTGELRQLRVKCDCCYKPLKAVGFKKSNKTKPQPLSNQHLLEQKSGIKMSTMNEMRI